MNLNYYYDTHERNNRKKRVKHGDIIYKSQSEACRELNISTPTIKKYLKFGEYEGESLKYMNHNSNEYNILKNKKSITIGEFKKINKFESKSETESETEQELTPEPETEQDSTPEPETEQELTPEPETEQDSTPEPETEQELTPDPETEQESTSYIEYDYTDLLRYILDDDIQLTKGDMIKLENNWESYNGEPLNEYIDFILNS